MAKNRVLALEEYRWKLLQKCKSEPNFGPVRGMPLMAPSFTVPFRHHDTARFTGFFWLLTDLQKSTVCNFTDIIGKTIYAIALMES